MEEGAVHHEVIESLSVSERLAEYIAALDESTIPQSVVTDSRWRLMDTLGVALAGARLDFAEPVRAVMIDMGGKPEATVIGAGDRLPAASAGFVNAALAHGPDFDDTHSVAMVHIGCLAVPAALAMAERAGASGASLMTALVAGAEVGLRIGAAAPHRFHLRGYHATGVVGPFVAASAAAKLLGLDAPHLAHALGLAGSQASGLLEGLIDGSWVKRLHPAWSVQAGITAALLAQRGFVGPREVLEGGAGLFTVLLHGDDDPGRPARVLDDLGSHWLLPETTYKPYSCGAWNHSSMDALRTIMRGESLDHDDVERVDVTVPVECVPIVCEPREAKIHPTSAYHMKFSLPYSLAIVAVLGHADVDDYSETVLRRREVADFAARVHCSGDQDMSPDNFPATVRVTTRTGRQITHAVSAQRGGPGSPFTREDHVRKFRANATPTLGQEGTEMLAEAIERIWEAPSVAPFAALLAGARS
jgi:2-methylcitrate dehydratase PrpD